MILHDLPVPTSDLEWKQLYREMGSFAVKVFINRTAGCFGPACGGHPRLQEPPAVPGGM